MELTVNIPQVGNNVTQEFSKIWTLNGVAITLDNTSIQFATDFANEILKQFVLTMARKSAQNIPSQATKEVSSLVEG
jgi:hypothetical protein